MLYNNDIEQGETAMSIIYPYVAVVYNSCDCELVRHYCDNLSQLKISMLEFLDTVSDGDRIEFLTDVEVD